jgi:hypothetical protein
VPGVVDDVVPGAGGFRRALDGDDAVVDDDGELGRVAEVRAEDQVLDDLAADVRVRPAVDAEHVRTGHDADQPAVVVGDREPLDPPVEHQPGGVGDGLAGADGHGRLGHQVGCGHRGRPGQLAVVRQAVQHTGDIAAECLLGEQVGLRDDPDDLVVGVDDREGADPVLAEPGGDLLVGGAFPNGDDVGTHHVLDDGVHG